MKLKTENEQLVNDFYTAFQSLDYSFMQSCYSANPIFNDPVFGILQGNEVRSMWEMLCRNAKNFSLEFNSVNVDDEYCTCKWIARYTFSKTGRKVVNKVSTFIRVQNGKITEHTDEFDLYRWSRQALGLPGILLGWSGYLKNKIRHDAKKRLYEFING
jgi:ketosteroid isomerase-like protein